MTKTFNARKGLLACTALASTCFMNSAAHAQGATPAAEDNGGLAEIIVTAQKREQSLQDVPIAVTAVTQEALQANRVVNVTDLSALAPGVTVRPSLGSSSIPSFTVRGAVSYGVVPGSDKQVSMYLDGVYLSSPRGAIFDLPNVQRIELLRGPQGTLFGRNATAGAVSISTADPTGEASAKLSGTYGNNDMFRGEVSVNTPEFGPFSAYLSYVRYQYRGHTRNGRIETFDRATNSLSNPKTVTSAPWLGGKKSDTFFAALKFESGDFRMVYKFDRNDAEETPGAVGLIGYDFTRGLGNLFGSYVNAIVSGQNGLPLATDGKRPDVVWNSYNTPTDQFQEGHNLTATYVVNDHVSIKNIAAYRSSAVAATATLSGVDALPIPASAAAANIAFLSASSPAFAALTPAQQQAAFAANIGQPYVLFGSGPASRSKQWSDELQVNYNSDFLTLTVGGMYFKSKDNTNEHGMQNTVAFTQINGGTIPYLPGIAYNEARSLAAYAQGEFHLTPQLDVILGGRFTDDKKIASLTSLTTATCPATITTSAGLKACPLITNTFNYKGSKFNYLLGVNFKPNDDILVYAKWSTAYVSGGKVGPIEFVPETAKSAEAGIKADLLDRHLRTNLSVFWAEYKNYQSAQGGNTLGALPEFQALVPDARIRNALGTFVYPQGDVTAKGFELEVTAAPGNGVVLGGSLSYTDTKFTNVPGLLKAASNLAATSPDSDYRPTFRPNWTANLYGQYTSQPVWGEARISARLQGNFQSKMIAAPNANIRSIFPFYTESVPAYWLINGRIALEKINVGGANATLAVWGKNITDNRSISFPFNQSGLASATFIEPRRYGVDVTIEF